MVTSKTETIQLGIRLDKTMIDEIDKIAQELGYERNFLIKKMIREELTELKKDLREEANNDYLDLRISKDEYKRIVGEFPDKDLEDARKELMRGLIQEKKKEK
jgi:hypothetical protein